MGRVSAPWRSRSTYHGWVIGCMSCPSYVMSLLPFLIKAYTYLHRNVEKRINGQRAQRPANPRRRRKRSERRSLPAKQRTRDCSQKKRRRPPRRKPLPSQPRRNPPKYSQSLPAPVPSPLGAPEVAPAESKQSSGKDGGETEEIESFAATQGKMFADSHLYKSWRREASSRRLVRA